jgi:hypothetical protein
MHPYITQQLVDDHHRRLIEDAQSYRVRSVLDARRDAVSKSVRSCRRAQ